MRVPFFLFQEGKSYSKHIVQHYNVRQDLLLRAQKGDIGKRKIISYLAEHLVIIPTQFCAFTVNYVLLRMWGCPM